VEFGPGVAECTVRWSDSPRLFHNPFHPAVVYPQAPGPSFQLDVRALWSVHRRLRHNPRDGGVESMARAILACRRSQGRHCGGFRTYRNPFGTAHGHRQVSIQALANGFRQTRDWKKKFRSGN